MDLPFRPGYNVAMQPCLQCCALAVMQRIIPAWAKMLLRNINKVKWEAKNLFGHMCQVSKSHCAE